jgi:anti-sigma factor RsiW
VDCARVDEELIAFELAALDGAKRAAVEAHLTGCSRCVSSLLALKRAIDAGEDASAPSAVTRARVRAEAARVVGASTAAAATGKRRERAPWVAVAVAAAAAVLAPIVYQMMRAPHKAALRGASTETPAPKVVPVKAGEGGETIDTARLTPENLAFL